MLAAFLVVLMVVGFVDVVAHTAGAVAGMARDGWTSWRRWSATFDRVDRQHAWDDHCQEALWTVRDGDGVRPPCHR